MKPAATAPVGATVVMPAAQAVVSGSMAGTQGTSGASTAGVAGFASPIEPVQGPQVVVIQTPVSQPAAPVMASGASDAASAVSSMPVIMTMAPGVGAPQMSGQMMPQMLVTDASGRQQLMAMPMQMPMGFPMGMGMGYPVGFMHMQGMAGMPMEAPSVVVMQGAPGGRSGDTSVSSSAAPVMLSEGATMMGGAMAPGMGPPGGPGAFFATAGAAGGMPAFLAPGSGNVIVAAPGSMMAAPVSHAPTDSPDSSGESTRAAAGRKRRPTKSRAAREGFRSGGAAGGGRATGAARSGRGRPPGPRSAPPRGGVGSKSSLAGSKTSLFRGVAWAANMGKWRSQITVAGRVKSLGYFWDEHVAAAAYDAARVRAGLSVVNSTTPAEQARAEAVATEQRTKRLRLMGVAGGGETADPFGPVQTPISGVKFDSQRNQWEAWATDKPGRSRFHVGFFDSESEAAAALKMWTRQRVELKPPARARRPFTRYVVLTAGPRRLRLRAEPSTATKRAREDSGAAQQAQGHPPPGSVAQSAAAAALLAVNGAAGGSPVHDSGAADAHGNGDGDSHGWNKTRGDKRDGNGSGFHDDTATMGDGGGGAGGGDTGDDAGDDSDTSRLSPDIESVSSDDFSDGAAGGESTPLGGLTRGPPSKALSAQRSKRARLLQ